MIDNSEKYWKEDAAKNGWTMESVAWWKRLPIVRHVRCAYLTIQAQRFRKMTHSMGLGIGGMPQKDSWVLYGIAKGYEGVK